MDRREAIGKALATITAIMFCAPATWADSLSGRASVIDGDTIEVRGERIRLLDIDAPEIGQTCGDSSWRCGQEAARALADFIGGQPVRCERKKRDRYGRWLARCSVAYIDLAGWLAHEGWAVPYHDCECPYVRLMAAGARANKRGVWSGPFIDPYLWRQ